jgi:hypothetical protein
MLYLDGGLILLALWLVCLIDVIVVDESRVKHLPKVLWVLIVLLVPDLGSLAWLIIGRVWDTTHRPVATTRVGHEFPEYDRPGRHVAVNPEDDAEFLRQLRARAEEQRERAREQRRARERQERDQQDID